MFERAPPARTPAAPPGRTCRLLSSLLGPRRGKRIDYLEANRYITNSLFADLVAQGWVGSSGPVSEAVMRVMEAALDNDRTVLLNEITLGERRGRSGPGTRRIEAKGFIPPD